MDAHKLHSWSSLDSFLLLMLESSLELNLSSSQQYLGICGWSEWSGQPNQVLEGGIYRSKNQNSRWEKNCARKVAFIGWTDVSIVPASVERWQWRIWILELAVTVPDAPMWCTDENIGWSGEYTFPLPSYTIFSVKMHQWWTSIDPTWTSFHLNQVPFLVVRLDPLMSVSRWSSVDLVRLTSLLHNYCNITPTMYIGSSDVSNFPPDLCFLL